jgi:hypothetical protein
VFINIYQELVEPEKIWKLIILFWKVQEPHYSEKLHLHLLDWDCMLQKLIFGIFVFLEDIHLYCIVFIHYICHIVMVLVYCTFYQFHYKVIYEAFMILITVSIFMAMNEAYKILYYGSRLLVTLTYWIICLLVRLGQHSEILSNNNEQYVTFLIS